MRNAIIFFGLFAASVVLAGEPVRVELQEPSDAGQQKALEVFQRIVKERTGLDVISAKDATLKFGFRTDIGAEGFSIEDGTDKTVKVSGNGMPGLMAGIGKLLRTARIEPGVFEPGKWRGVSVPKMPVRGIYFATHFFNWYHVAPIEEVRKYVEELALWGCNTLDVWFDMHHYQGLDDPEAQAMIRRLREILQAGQEVGLKPATGGLANEGYASSPENIRAEWGPQNGYVQNLSHYHVEVCPNKAGGMEYILKTRRAMLEAFKGVDLKYLFLWPYDQGGCTCIKCFPWGANGFIKASSELSVMCRQMFPNAQIILSTWWFDHCIKKGDLEWRAFDKVVSETNPKWIDYLMADAGTIFPPYLVTNGVPGNLPLLNFPEISMFNSQPWGGYGANPAPERLKNIWAPIIDKLSGGYPYSEGIFEDINKCIALQLYWNRQDPMQTVKEYIAYEFSPAVAEDMTGVVAEMETSFSHQVFRPKPDSYENLKKKLYSSQNGPKGLLYKATLLKNSKARLEKVKQAEAKMDARVRNSWRWRIFYLRAGIDAELESSGGKPSDALDACLDELNRIYHADNAIFQLRPPSRRALLDLFGSAGKKNDQAGGGY